MPISEIFNQMADEYDDLKDLWYAWLFSRLHYYIVKEIITKKSPETVLDVGCGTGFQSFLHAAGGAIVNGIDIAADLVKTAQKKSLVFNPETNVRLFPVWFKFVEKYNIKMNDNLKGAFKTGNYTPPLFEVADATNLPFDDNMFDHVNCCGSTLSFIENHKKVLLEMVRVLKPGGSILLEVESRWNFDLFWSFLDTIVFGVMGYEASFKEALKDIFFHPRKYISTEYPFGDSDNPIYMEIVLFTSSGLRRELKKIGIDTQKQLTIHSITNIIPSTFLDSAGPSLFLKILFSFFAKIEENCPIHFPGCSLVLIGQKT